MNNDTLPTFDEWYEAKLGQSFEALWMQDWMQIDHGMRALTVAIRDYMTEMARLAAAKNSKDDPKTPGGRQGFEPFGYAERS